MTEPKQYPVETSLWAFCSTMTNNWIEVNLEGLREMVDIKHTLRELIANAFDEQINGATECKVDITYHSLWMSDDSPNGFADLSDSYTLFRNTPKRANPEVRGRFNSGEKAVLAHSTSANICSTSGTVRFLADGTRHFDPLDKTDKGSIVNFYMDVDRELFDYWEELIKQIKVPKNFTLWYGPTGHQYQKPLSVVDAVLPTWYLDETRKVVPRRKTKIFIYEEDTPYIYEMGIPIQKLDEDRFSYDIQQKVPLDQNRDMVSPKYLKEIRGATLNAVSELIGVENLQDTWIIDALESKNLKIGTFDKVIEKVYPKTMLKSNDPQANENAILAGYSLVSSKQVPKAIRDRLNSDHGDGLGRSLLASAGKFAPSRTAEKSVFTTRELTVWMKRVAELAKTIAKKTINRHIVVEFYESDATVAATYGRGVLSFNVKNLGRDWFAGPLSNILNLIIHELGHYRDTDYSHLSMTYVNALSKIGAGVAVLALNEPEIFKDFT